MSDTTYLYRLYDETGQLLYIGISNRAARRWIQHLDRQPWADQIHRMERGKSYDNRAQAIAAERLAIMSEGPLHNIVHNDYRDDTPITLTPQEHLQRWVPVVLNALEAHGESTRQQLAEYLETEPERLTTTLLYLADTHRVAAINGMWALTGLQCEAGQA